MAIDKNQTGLASEFFVAAELFRRKWDVTLSFGNTKRFDLIASKDKKEITIQVKGIYATKSGNWNINKEKLKSEKTLIIIFVNLNSDKLDLAPEYFILTALEALEFVVDKNKANESVKQNYLPYNRLKSFKNNWERIEEILGIQYN